MMNKNYSELWKTLPWRKARKIVFRLQCRIFKAVQAGDNLRAKNLQKLLLKSQSARLLAIRQITQLNQGKKTAGVDGKASLSHQERLELNDFLKSNYRTWKHNKLREIPIQKKDGTLRILKVPTIADRVWQTLIKLAVEPAAEATFHARSYGFRPGRSAHDAQKIIFINLRSYAHGINKRVLELDIEKCFDRIAHNQLVKQIIAPQFAMIGLRRCLKSGVSLEFPEQGVPQGGSISPLLANIALNGIEEIHPSVRYADDMIFFLKPQDDAELIRSQIDEFLAERGLKVKEAKTKLVKSTEGFDFLGWHFKVQSNGKFRSYPSKENYRSFIKKVKQIVNCSNYGAKVKSKKLAPIVRGWRNYHKYCHMSNHHLWHTSYRTFKVFLKEEKTNRYEAEKLVKLAFPPISYSENRFANVKGKSSPYDGNLTYWSERNSKLYDGYTAKTLTKQNHKCGHCNLKFNDNERVHLHHIDRNHDNWKANNLLAVHESCHDYIHTMQPS